MRAVAVFREAIASAWGTKVASAVSIVMVAGMVLAVLLTAGRTVGTQQSVVDTLDDEGTRSVVVRAQDGSGLDSSSLARLQGVSSIAWAGGFGPAVDVTNAQLPGGAQVPIRSAYGVDLATLGLSEPSLPGAAYASDLALSQLGMANAAGSVITSDGTDYSIGGRVTVPDHLAFLEPLLIVPTEAEPPENLTETSTSEQVWPGDPLTLLVVLATDASQVESVRQTVLGVIDVQNPEQISVETSETLAELRQLIDAQLTGSGRALVMAIFGLTSVLVAAVLYALVMMRRRDFGRRRALGASRGLILALILAQSTVSSLVGAVVGGVASFVVLAAGRDPQPPGQYYLAIMLLAAFTAVVAALLPAVAAATRDPARELRVP